jgi:hypothetical protein
MLQDLQVQQQVHLYPPPHKQDLHNQNAQSALYLFKRITKDVPCVTLPDQVEHLRHQDNNPLLLLLVVAAVLVAVFLLQVY